MLTTNNKNKKQNLVVKILLNAWTHKMKKKLPFEKQQFDNNATNGISIQAQPRNSEDANGLTAMQGPVNIAYH